jgi:hypothetical protein
MLKWRDGKLGKEEPAICSCQGSDILRPSQEHTGQRSSHARGRVVATKLPTTTTRTTATMLSNNGIKLVDRSRILEDRHTSLDDTGSEWGGTLALFPRQPGRPRGRPRGRRLGRHCVSLDPQRLCDHTLFLLGNLGLSDVGGD